MSKANYIFTIDADTGYQSTTEGRCTAEQYGQAIAALHNQPPQQRTWVGLTDEEQIALLKDSDGKTRHWLVWQVEAKLRNKNGY